MRVNMMAIVIIAPPTKCRVSVHLGCLWVPITDNMAIRRSFWLPLAFFFLVAAAFLMVAPFIRPPGGIGDTPPLPCYLYCLTGIGILVGVALYWAAWKFVLPYVFGFRLVQRKEELKDGTVVTMFSRAKVE